MRTLTLLLLFMQYTYTPQPSDIKRHCGARVSTQRLAHKCAITYELIIFKVHVLMIVSNITSKTS